MSNATNFLDQVAKNPVLSKAVNEPTPDGEPGKYTKDRRLESLERARQAKAGKKAQSAGVGESRMFVAPEDDPIRSEGGPDWSRLTINGLPVPEHMRARIPYELTDQGIEEKNVGRVPGDVRVLRDPRDKAIDRYRDDLKNGVPLAGQMERDGVLRRGDDSLAEDNNDPFSLLMKQHVPPGMHGLMMSAKTVRRQGLRRGRLIYKPLLDEQGKRIGLEGDANEMFIGVVPEEQYQAELGRHSDFAREKAVRAQDKVREHNDRAMSERVRGRAERRHADDFEGLVDDTEAVMDTDNREFITGDQGKEFLG